MQTQKNYQQAVGALMYLMIAKRPDLAYAVGTLGRHTTAPGEEHLQALNTVFRYLQGTKGHELTFKKGATDASTPKGFADADQTSDRNEGSRHPGTFSCSAVGRWRVRRKGLTDHH
jgi:hypothetical protein